MHEMQVSVIIPVYNATRYLEEAVLSALGQPETAEVLLIEDGSTDESLVVCEKLTEVHARVRLLRHPGGQNLGAGATRNLGMAHATSEYIAFLDADDVYLPLRFRSTKSVFQAHPDAHGVYETIGLIYADTSLRDKHLDRTGSERTGLTTPTPPALLFRALATGKHGHLHLNGLTIRKSAIDAQLLFDTSLRQCQDSDWILRLARYRRLYPGNIDQPVALRRVHMQNRVLNKPEAVHYQKAYLYKSIVSDFHGSRDRYANLYLVARYISWRWNGRLRRLGAISSPAIVFVTGAYLISRPALLYRLFIQ